MDTLPPNAKLVVKPKVETQPTGNSPEASLVRNPMANRCKPARVSGGDRRSQIGTKTGPQSSSPDVGLVDDLPAAGDTLTSTGIGAKGDQDVPFGDRHLEASRGPGDPERRFLDDLVVHPKLIARPLDPLAGTRDDPGDFRPSPSRRAEPDRLAGRREFVSVGPAVDEVALARPFV